MHRSLILWTVRATDYSHNGLFVLQTRLLISFVLERLKEFKVNHPFFFSYSCYEP